MKVARALRRSDQAGKTTNLVMVARQAKKLIRFSIASLALRHGGSRRSRTVCQASSAAEPAERLAHRGLKEQLLRAAEARREQRGVRAVEHIPDIIVGRDLLDPEQGLAVRAPLPLLQRPLEREEGHALHEKHGEGGQTEIRHGDIAAPPLARVRKRGANRLQAREKRRQNLHP